VPLSNTRRDCVNMRLMPYEDSIFLDENIRYDLIGLLEKGEFEVNRLKKIGKARI
jgi:hypothetical protein